MGKTRPLYPREYREEAVRLVREPASRSGRSPRTWGSLISPLRNWVVQADLDSGRRTDGLTTEEREELRRLRRENRILREEREILKKVSHAALCGTNERMKVFVEESGNLVPRWT